MGQQFLESSDRIFRGGFCSGWTAVFFLGPQKKSENERVQQESPSGKEENFSPKNEFLEVAFFFEEASGTHFDAVSSHQTEEQKVKKADLR